MIKLILLGFLLTNVFADFYALRVSKVEINVSEIPIYNDYDNIVPIQYYDSYYNIINIKYKTIEAVELAQNIRIDLNTSIVKIKDYKLISNEEILNSIKNKEISIHPIKKHLSNFDVHITNFNIFLKQIKIPVPVLSIILESLVYIMFGIIVFVLGYKFMNEIEAKKIKLLRSNIKAKIFRSVESSTQINFIPKKDYEYIAVIDGCVSVISQLTKEEDYSSIKPIHTYLESINAFDFLYAKITNPFVIGKVEFIERLGLTLYEDNKFFLFFILHNNIGKHNRINEHAIAGLSYLVNRFDIQFFLSHVVKLNSSGKFLEFVFSNILKNLIAHKHHSGIAFILTFLYKVENNSILLKSFVEAIGFINYGQLRHELCDLYHMTLDDGVKTTILRTLGKLVSNKEVEKVLFLALIDKTPLLRITAAKSLVIVDLKDNEELLISALSDPVYHVRLNIALTLSKSEFGRSILEYIIETSSDKYARDMANHALIMYKRFEQNEAVLAEHNTVPGNVDDYI